LFYLTKIEEKYSQIQLFRSRLAILGQAPRAGIKYRALAVEIEEGILWFWVGKHDDYDKLISK